MSKIWIKDGHLVNPSDGLDGIYQILIEDGKIIYVGENPEIDEVSCQVIDAGGMIVAPGLVDVHTHFRDPGFTYKEDLESGSRAAVKGGFTSVVLMANTKPVVDNVDTLRYVLDKGAQMPIHVYSCACVTKGMKGQELTDMEELKRNGAVGFTDDGLPILDENMVRLAMEEAARLNVPISFHEEDPAYIGNNGINRGKVSEQLGISGSPKEAEITMIERDVKIAMETGASIDIQHISTLEGVALVREARKQCNNVHAEATPHHFSLTEEAVLKHGTLAKMNPPLRTEEDRQAIIEGLKDGTIDMIATDHAPHSPEEKAKPLTEAPSGILGLETALSLAVTNLVRPGHLTMMEVVDRMSYAPAKLYHLEAGEIAVGKKADLVIFRADEMGQVGPFASKSQNSPFAGEKLYGVVHYTICDGEIVYSKHSNFVNNIYKFRVNIF